MPIDLSIDDRVLDIAARTREFIRDVVLPVEAEHNGSFSSAR